MKDSSDRTGFRYYLLGVLLTVLGLAFLLFSFITFNNKFIIETDGVRRVALISPVIFLLIHFAEFTVPYTLARIGWHLKYRHKYKYYYENSSIYSMYYKKKMMNHDIKYVVYMTLAAWFARAIVLAFASCDLYWLLYMVIVLTESFIISVDLFDVREY